MRRGCISLGEVQCNQCQRIIPNAEYYLVIDEEDSTEPEKTVTARYCVECALKKGYAAYKEERDEKILTFFP